VDEILFFDIKKSEDDSVFDLDFIRQLTDECSVPITIGGGVKKIHEITNLLLTGADKVALNTELYSNPDLVDESSKKFGAQTIVVGIDFKEVGRNTFKCVSHSGKKIENVDPISWAIECAERGAGELIITSIDKDGLMKGYDTDMLKKISSKVTIPIVASGGAGSYKDMLDAFNKGASAVAAASIYHFTEQTPAEAKRYLDKNNVLIRKNLI
jgi:cyclase